MPTEQEVLSNTLKSPTEGGSASGILGAGADVPEVLAENPATRQLLQESVYTQTGQTDKAVASSETYNATKPAPSVVTSELADTRNTENQTTLNNYETQLQNTNSTGTTTTKTPAPTAPAEDADPLQTKIDSAVSALDTEYNQAAGMLDSRMASLDAANQAAVENIKRVFAVRREEAKLLNSQLMGTVTKAGIRSGRQRYASEINAGILTDQEQQGLARLSQLDAAELQLISEAKAANDGEQFSLLSKKLDLISQTRREKDQAIKDLNKAAMEAEAAALEKAKTMREFAKYDREDASASVDAMVKAGLDPAAIPQDYLNKLDVQAGYVPGTSKGLLELGNKEREQLDLESQVDQATKLNSLLRDLPVGETITLNGVKYNSLNTGTIQTSAETEANGDVWKIAYNEDTQEVTRTFLGNFGNKPFKDITSKEGAVLRLFDDGTQRLMYDSRQPDGGTAQGGIISKFPEGSITPFTRKEGGLDRASECGAWVNDLTGLGVGNLFSDKMAKMDKSITADTAEIGDVFVQAYGDTGHIGIINAISVVDGETYFTVSESNWKKQPGSDGKIGLITHSRQMKASDVKGYARPGFKDPSYSFGTDAPDLTGLNFGETDETTTFGMSVDGETPIKTVTLTEKQIKDIDASPQGKNLNLLRNLRSGLQEYGDAVNLYGLSLSGANAAKLDEIYSNLKILWKNAAELGALTGPDIAILEEAIKPASGLKGAAAFAAGGGKEGVAGAVQQQIDRISSKQQTNYQELLLRNPDYEFSDYVRAFAPEATSSQETSQASSEEPITDFFNSFFGN